MNAPHATAPVDVAPRGDVLRILTQEEIVILVRVLAAVAVGASIGFERTFHGRVAVVDSSHHHGPGCGHIFVKGVWYDER